MWKIYFQLSESEMKFLKDHPFSVSAFFDRSTVLAFAVDKAQIQSLIPDCLELDTWQDKWAFIAVAFVLTKNRHSQKG